MQKDKEILLKIVKNVQKMIFWPIITKLLYIYMMFAIHSLNFLLIFLQKIVIYKNNNIYVFLNPSFNISIFSLKFN